MTEGSSRTTIQYSARKCKCSFSITVDSTSVSFLKRKQKPKQNESISMLRSFRCLTEVTELNKIHQTRSADHSHSSEQAACIRQTRINRQKPAEYHPHQEDPGDAGSVAAHATNCGIPTGMAPVRSSRKGLNQDSYKIDSYNW